MICISVSKEVRHFSYFLVEYLSIGAAKGHNKSAICPGKGGGGRWGFGGEGGYSIKVYTVRPCPEVQPL